MDAFFEQAERELNLCYLECMNYIKSCDDLNSIAFLESGESPNTKKKTEGIISRIAKMVDTAIEKIRTFFTRKQVVKTTEQLESTINENPSLKNRKVKIRKTENEKLADLQAETIKKLSDTKPEEVDKVMDDYHKKSNKLKAIGVGAVAAVSVGALLIHFKNKSKKSEQDLNKVKKKAEEAVKKNPEASSGISQVVMDQINSIEKEIDEIHKEADAALVEIEKEKKMAQRQVMKGRMSVKEFERINNKLSNESSKIMNESHEKVVARRKQQNDLLNAESDKILKKMGLK